MGNLETQLIERALTPEHLAQLTDDEIEQLEYYSQFVESLIVIEGRKGSGKSQLAISLCWNLRKYFALPTICDQPLKDSYGGYTHIDEQMFVGEIDKFSTIAKNTPQNEVELAVKWALERQGIKLENSVIWLDEAYKYFDCRTPSDKLVRIFGYFIAMMRHYSATVIICCPSRRYLDQRVIDQVDWLTKVGYDSEEEEVHARFLNWVTGEVVPGVVPSVDYRDFYYSKAPISLRKKVLNITRSM